MPKFTMKISIVLVLLATCVTALAGDSAAEQARADALAAEANAKAAEDHKHKLENQRMMEVLEAQIRKQTGLVDVTPQAVRRLIATLQEQREQLELDRAGAEGRREGLEEAVAKLSKRLAEGVASDDVVGELQKVVDVRQLELARLKQLQNNGAVAASEVSAAEANVAIARAELAAARQKSISNASSEALDGWNRQLLELSVTSLEQSARLRYLEKRLAELSAAIDNVNRVEQLRIELDLPQHLDARFRDDTSQPRGDR